ncbi:MAG: hypothetical protein EOO43_18950 [Flavobacterium sp.]|nr:MAG: hypothetical protein EOO43_18950 [Flavobacterium sp.]
MTESLKAEKELTTDLQEKLSKAITREVYMQIIDELKGAKGRVISLVNSLITTNLIGSCIF